MKKLLPLLFLFCTILLNAQNFEYQVLFHGIGDNREYFNPLALPQTIIGTRGAFEIGVETNGHRLRGGLSELFEFGSDIDQQKPKLTLYYQFQSERKEFIFGSFPRHGKIDFPLAMLTDTLQYYRPNIEGLFGEVGWNWGKQNAFVDWVSRQTDFHREQFMVGSSGEIFHGNLFLANYILLFHDAKPAIRIPDDHIKDYFGYAVQAGIRTNENSKIKAHVKAGILSSLYRNRGMADNFVNATSFFAEAQGRYKNWAIKSVLSSGAGHNFNYGDLFYRAKDYWRTDVVWHFINHEKVKGTFNLSFHLIEWKDLNQQQQLSIFYIFGNNE